MCLGLEVREALGEWSDELVGGVVWCGRLWKVGGVTGMCQVPVKGREVVW